MLRPAPALLVLVAMSVIVGGCGNGSDATNRDAQVRVFAGVVNLRISDASGMTLAPSNAVLSDGAGSAKCAGGEGNTAIVSRPLVGRRWETFSYVIAMSNEVAAARFVSALGTPRGASCFVPEAGSSPAPSVTRLAAKLPAGQPCVGFRTVTNSPERHSERLYLDIFLFPSGSAVVGLVALSGDTPPPKAAEQRLLSILSRRAQAHKI